MTDKDDKDSAPSKDEGKALEQTPPEGTSSDKGDERPSGEAPSELPEKFRGKSAEELVRMYREAEKKIGEQSAEVKDARETKKNVEILLGAIYADPKRYQEASNWIKEYLGQGTQEQTAPSESGEKAKTRTQSPPATDDTRRALQNQILADFYKQHGLTDLPEDERKGEQTKIATAFADLVDPGGTKSTAQLLNEIPLDRLPKYLDSAYKLANADRIANEGRQKGLLTAEENRQASIGSLSSSGGLGEEMTLTQKERAVAEKMGVKPEDYLKAKKDLEEASK